MSPYEIGVLLHYYCCVEDHPHVNLNPPAWPETVRRFKEIGVLRDGDPDFDNQRRYSLTPLGTAYCRALQRVPLPVQKWVLPATEETTLDN